MTGLGENELPRFVLDQPTHQYKALLQGMTMVQKIGGKAVEVFSDSRLVVGQVKGELKAKDVRM